MKKFIKSILLGYVIYLMINPVNAQRIYAPVGIPGVIGLSGDPNNVLIGLRTYVPESQLHVIGDIRIRKTDKLIFGDQANGVGEWIQNSPVSWGLSFFGNSQERMRMTNDGYFGIGNAISPANRLHVIDNTSDPVRIQTLRFANDSSIVTIDAAGVLHQRRFNFNGIARLSCSTQFYVPVNDGTGALRCSQIYDNGTSVGIAANTGFSYSRTSGMLSGANPAPYSGTIKLQVNGVIRSLANIVTSDQTLKTNISDIKSPLDIVKLLNGNVYNWNDKAQKAMNADNGKHFGFLAQKVQIVLPEIVIKDENGVLGINYNEVIPILVEAMKEQQKNIVELTSRIKIIETQKKY